MASGIVNFETGSSVRSEELVAHSKIGIGTHTQTANVHCVADAPVVVVEDKVGNATQTALRITADGGTTHFQSGVDLSSDSKGDFKFQSMLGGTTHLTIDGTNSRVGVGTASPASLLHVEDGVLTVKNTSEISSMYLIPDGDGTGGSLNQHYYGSIHAGVAQFIAEQSENLPTISITNKDRDNNVTKNASIGFFNSDTSGKAKYGARIACYPEDANGIDQSLRIYTKNGGGSGSGYSFPAHTATFSSDGHVGIGSTTPSSTLDVNGNVHVSSNLEINGEFRVSDASSNVVDASLKTNGNWKLEQKVLDPQDTRLTGNYFALAAHMSDDGNTLAVGCIYGDTYVGGTTDKAGIVFVFERSGDRWLYKAELTHTNPGASDYLGLGIGTSADGSIIVAGANQKNETYTSQGAVYVFVRNGSSWSSMTETAKLLQSSTNISVNPENFGYSCFISGDGNTIVASCRKKSVGSNAQQGAVYVYEKPGSGWADATEDAFLLATNGAVDDFLGEMCHINYDGTVVVSGAGGRNVLMVWEKPTSGGWVDATASAVLTSPDSVSGDNFGAANKISYDGNFILVGATVANKVYVYEKPSTGWATTNSYAARLTDSDNAASDNFGLALGVSRDGSVVFVGAYGDDDLGSESGSAYIFYRPSSGWTDATEADHKIVPTGLEAGDNFGRWGHMSTDGERVIMCARGDDSQYGSNSGSVYVYKRNSSQLAVSNSHVTFAHSIGIGTTEIIPDVRLDVVGSASIHGYLNMSERNRLKNFIVQKQVYRQGSNSNGLDSKIYFQFKINKASSNWAPGFVKITNAAVKVDGNSQTNDDAVYYFKHYSSGSFSSGVMHAGTSYNDITLHMDTAHNNYDLLTVHCGGVYTVNSRNIAVCEVGYYFGFFIEE